MSQGRLQMSFFASLFTKKVNCDQNLKNSFNERVDVQARTEGQAKQAQIRQMCSCKQDLKNSITELVEEISKS